jgi:hypothetical protein
VKRTPAASALVCIGAIVFLVGCIVGRTPVTFNDSHGCGSAWFLGVCLPGVHDSSMGISMTLLLIGAAAGIAGTVMPSQQQPPRNKSGGGKKSHGKKILPKEESSSRHS